MAVNKAKNITSRTVEQVGADLGREGINYGRSPGLRAFPKDAYGCRRRGGATVQF